MAGCWAARVVTACVDWRDSVVAAWRSVKSVVNKIRWVAVQVGAGFGLGAEFVLWLP